MKTTFSFCKKFLILAIILSSFILSGCATCKNANLDTRNTVQQPIGIVCALPAETDYFLKQMQDRKQKKLGDIVFNYGFINNKPVAIVESNVGKIMAASSTSALIQQFNVKAIIFSGVAGAVGNGLRPNDLIIGSSLVQHDFGAFEAKVGFVWKNFQFGYNNDPLIPDSALFAKAKECAESVLGKSKVHTGVIVTGDQFIASNNMRKRLVKNHSAMACEMEGYAVARVAMQHSVPWVVIRCLSDSADDKANKDYDFNLDDAAVDSAKVVIEMLGKI